MTGYFATCARGLEPVLARELVALGADSVEPGRGGVKFRGDSALLYRAGLWLRTAVRVLRPMLEADVFSTDELYDAVRTINWADFMTPDHTLAVDCNVRDSVITHSQYAARRVKDAICDQFRERVGRRPSVDPEQPMVGFNLHVHKDHAILSLDSSWSSLHKRGYRPIQTIAPLNEALAAGLLMQAGWTPDTPLVDPMCGSATFCIEGAWMALNRAPGLTRKWFGFQGWREFDRVLWNAIRDDARASVKKDLPAPIISTDVHPSAIDLANQNARNAGVAHLLKLERKDIGQTRPPAGVAPGVVICNPPYGERIGEEKEWVPLYTKLGQVIRDHWPGWRLFVFTSNDMLARKVKLPVKHRTPFFNGKIECQLWEYGTGNTK
jgi:putative N6-adenine-specific DNA methylase